MTAINSSTSTFKSWIGGITTPGSSIWRHTIGRVSCAARAPMYLLTACAQIPKMGLKSIWSTGQLAVNAVQYGCIFVNNQLKLTKKPMPYQFAALDESWTFTGVAKDGAAMLNYLQRTVNASWCAVIAPPQQYKSFLDEGGRCLATVFKGKYHKGSFEDFKELTQAVPNYLGQISLCFRTNAEGKDLAFKWINA